MARGRWQFWGDHPIDTTPCRLHTPPPPNPQGRPAGPPCNYIPKEAAAIETPEPDRQPRESIWSIIAPLRPWYFGIFVLVFIPGTGINIAIQIADNDAIMRIWHNALMAEGAIAMASAAISFTLTESWRAAMVIAHDIQKWLDKRRQKQLEAARAEGRAEGEAKGRNEGRKALAENQQAWTEWNARRLDAESRGENFTEPPPNGNIG